MGTKFMAFKEDGTAYRLKGRILRFLDAEPVTDADKSNMRDTLGITGTSGDLISSNNLSDVSSAATSRTNLNVNSKDEDAQANALKTTAPSMYFNGSSSYVTVADDDKLTFSTLTEFGKTTAGTWSPEDNTPALTDGTGTLNDHYKIDADGTVAQGGSTLSIINGSSVTAGQVVYYDGSVWRVKDCDDLPFSVSGWIKMTDATRFCIAGKWNGSDEWLLYVTASDYLQFATRDSGSDITSITSNAALTSYEGQWIHVAATYGGAGPSAASGAAFTANMSGGNAALFINGVSVAATALDNASYGGMSNLSSPVWLGRYSSNYSSGEVRQVTIHNRELSATEIETLFRAGQLGAADIRNVQVTQLGTLADFRSERYDTSTSKLYDISDNAFVGTGTSVSLTGMEQPVYSHGTWTPSITFGGGSTGITYGTQEGYYTRVGNTVHITCVISLTSKGSDTGSAVVEGLPFTSRNTSGSAQTIGPVLATTMASLGSVPCAVAGDATSNAQLFDSSASGFSFLDDTNFNNTSAIRFSGTYQIQ